MKINYMNGTIELTKSEMKQAENFGSEMYKRLCDARHEFPNYTVKLAVTTKKKRDNFKGLNAAYMKKYIEKHDDEKKSKMAQFYELRGLDENGNAKDFAAVASMGELRQWFLVTFPEVADMTKGVDEIMKNVRAEKEKQKEEAEKKAQGSGENAQDAEKKAQEANN